MCHVVRGRGEKWFYMYTVCLLALRCTHMFPMAHVVLSLGFVRRLNMPLIIPFWWFAVISCPEISLICRPNLQGYHYRIMLWICSALSIFQESFDRNSHAQHVVKPFSRDLQGIRATNQPNFLLGIPVFPILWASHVTHVPSARAHRGSLSRPPRGID